MKVQLRDEGLDRGADVMMETQRSSAAPTEGGELG